MWLIHTSTLKLKEIVNLEDCKYVILSHTWGEEEINFQEMQAQLPSIQEKAGFRKIKKTCEVAYERGYHYAWVDTCCIDKTSSAALAEAINSMFNWYKESSMCFTFLSDLVTNGTFQYKESETIHFMRQCRWFTRGWTLQELIAPEELEFYDRDWQFRGTKKTLRKGLSNITGIDVDVLVDSELLPTIPVGRRMSWAAGRRTTRVEDTAYCLFGIFGVNMPMIYGEGKMAFLRLQDEIAKETNDLTLFAWTSQDESGTDRRPIHQSHHRNKGIRGILAQSPDEFVNCGKLKIIRDRIAPVNEFAMTNNGLRIETVLGSSPSKEYIFALECINEDSHREERLGVYLLKTETGFVRDRAYEIFTTTDKMFWIGASKTIYIARNLTPVITERLRTQLSRSLQFEFNLGPYTLYQIDGRPSSLWDKNRRRFLTGNHKDFTACMEFTIKPKTWWRFVIVCGLIEITSENSRVKDPWDEARSNYDDVVPWIAIYTNQDPLAIQQLEIIDYLKNADDELRELREKVLSWHTDEDRCISIRQMGDQFKSTGDEDGEIRYHVDMVKAKEKGSRVFKIRVFLSDLGRVGDGSDPMEDAGSDEDNNDNSKKDGGGGGSRSDGNEKERPQPARAESMPEASTSSPWSWQQYFKGSESSVPP